MQEHQPSENSKAIVGSIKFFAACIILAAVVYSEVLFLGIIGNLFPSGPLAIGAMIGAVTTGLSIIALCLGKSHWFRPGQQLIVAWIFTGLEVAVLVMNDILAYQLHTGAQLDQFTSTWRLFCVATPALSLVGWILLFYFSPERTIMHKRMELEDRQAKAKVALDTKVHQKAMHFHYRAIDMVGSGMERDMERLMPQYTELAARQKLAAIASDLVGSHISHTQLTSGTTPKQLSAKVVDANPPKQLAASRDHTVDPHDVKSDVEGKKKKMPLIDFSLPKDVKGKETQKIETSPDEGEEEEQEQEQEQEIEQEQEPDLMELPIDQRWQEYTALNAETATPQKKRGRKRAKQED